VPITGNWRSLELNSSEHEVVAASARVARRKWVKRYRTRCPLGPFIPQFQTLCCSVANRNGPEAALSPSCRGGHIECQVDDPATSRRIFPPRCACATACLIEERG
jgi:hypothetical protein